MKETKNRAVSPIIGTMLMISLVVAASVFVAIFISNIRVPAIEIGEETTPLYSVKIDVIYFNITDTNANGLNDTFVVKFNLDLDSPTIYVQDIDILLPIGNLLDDTVPWVIVDSNSSWNSDFYGYSVLNGSLNATFTVQCYDLSTSVGEIAPGYSFYYLIKYNYVSVKGNQLTLISDVYQSELIETK
ncbi:MAG: archaellin/type IV pilin N-terminal domain-containing protein [Candidatus Heimdallarchaeaceae archaeon]